MGAAWILQNKYTTILLPGFEFKEIKGAINPRKIGLKLDNDLIDVKEKLGELKDVLINEFNLSNKKDIIWEKMRDDFIKSLDKIENKNSKNISKNSLLNNIKGNELKLGENYKSFFESSGCLGDAEHIDIDEMNSFAKKISNLNYELREVIYAGCIKQLPTISRYTYMYNIRFNSHTVADYLGDNKEVFNRFKQLYQLNYLDEVEDDILYLKFEDSGNNFDILLAVAEYCKDNMNQLQEILLGLNFTSLD